MLQRGRPLRRQQGRHVRLLLAHPAASLPSGGLWLAWAPMQQLLVIVTLRARHAALPRAFARRGQRLFQTSTSGAPCLGLSQLPSARGVSVTAAAASARITPFAPPHREALPSASRGRHAAGPPGALAPQLDHHGAARVRGRGGQRAGRRRRRRPPVVARAARLREPVRATVRTAAAPHAGTLGTARRTSQHHLYSYWQTQP